MRGWGSGGSRRRRGLAAAAGLVVFLATTPTAARAEQHQPTPLPQWTADRVRVENLDPGGFLSVKGVGDFRGSLDVVRSGAGVGVVNEVGLEDYVRGVSEVPASWPLEAQRAQAIAARTYALHEMRRAAPTPARALGAHICATQACQVYAGLAKERARMGERWVAAVESTRGQVLLHRGSPILAKYSSSNGGRSVAGGRPYLASVADPDDARSPDRWRVSLTYAQLSGAFATPAPVTGVQVDGDGLVLVWALPDGGRGSRPVPAPEVRSRFLGGRDSTRYLLSADDRAGTVVIEGGGRGHGVGMSQYGALGKALRGLKAPAILASYYGGIRPTVLPPQRLPAGIRVALEGTGPAVDVSGSGRFRLLDGAGRPLAVVATGTWRVVPGPGATVRVLPPPGQEGVPGLQPTGHDPPNPGAGVPVSVRFRLSAPAMVSAKVDGPTGPVPAVGPPQLVEGGEAALALAPLPQPGAYTVSLAADAGAGRVATAPHLIEVVSPPPAPLLSVEPPPPPRRLEPPAAPLQTGEVPSPVPSPSSVLVGLLALAVTGLSASRAFRRAGQPHRS